MRFSTSLTKLVFVLSLVAFISVLSSCSQNVAFQTSSVVPGADGNIRISKDNNNNRVVKVQVANLADPNRLEPPRNVYVVWMVVDNGSTKNIGKIQSSRSLFSKRLTGELGTTTTFKPTRIFITAEDDGDIQYPQQQVVLTTKDF